MSNIERLYKEWRAAQPLAETLQRRIDQSFMIDFNYNSNHLEGNTLTYGQTKILLLFGRVEGEALMRDYEEMKAHNIGLELMKREAQDKSRSLSENFIRELNNKILVGDFYKTSHNGEYRYKIHTGVYKTRPNSVITPSGVMFDYASPEETPSLMSDLVAWYRTEEAKKRLSVTELAALFHYRYIRIHPFEDGNGRIARLLVNYTLYRHGYPMIVIPTTDRTNYLNVLGKCDKITGTFPFDGANASLEQIQPFVDYIGNMVAKRLMLSIQLAKGETTLPSEVDVPEKTAENQYRKENNKVNVPENVPENSVLRRQEIIVNFIKANHKISTTEIAGLLSVNPKTIKRDIQQLKQKGIIAREGSERSGYWKVLL